MWDFMTLLPVQALATLAIVLGLIFWSKRRTKKAQERETPGHVSPLARAEPDPKFKPDAEVTDPHHVNH